MHQNEEFSFIRQCLGLSDSLLFSLLKVCGEIHHRSYFQLKVQHLTMINFQKGSHISVPAIFKNLGVGFNGGEIS